LADKSPRTNSQGGRSGATAYSADLYLEQRSFVTAPELESQISAELARGSILV
jgi:hypothetical protein